MTGPLQASTVLKLLQALQDIDASHHAQLMQAAIVESIFSNYGLLSSQSDRSMLQLSELLLSQVQLRAAYFGTFATAVTKRLDNYSLLRSLLESPDVQAKLLLPEVQQMVACQITTLEKADVLPFSWHMPKAKLRKYPQVESFLQGPDTNFKLTGFASILEAEDVASSFTKTWGPDSYGSEWNSYTHGKYSGTFSFTATGMMDGGEVFINICKTKHWYERLIECHIDDAGSPTPLEKELKVIQLMVRQTMSE